MKSLISILFSWVLIVGCSSNSDDDVSVEITGCPLVEVVKHTSFEKLNQEDFKLLSYSVTGNTLKLDLNVTGCNFQRNFRFYIDSEKSKTNPNSHNAKLIYDNQTCPNQFDMTICFDLNTIERPASLVISSQTGTTTIVVD